LVKISIRFTNRRFFAILAAVTSINRYQDTIMYAKVPTDAVLPAVPYDQPTLPYEKPQQGVNYWVEDDFFPEAQAKEIAKRCFNKKKWILGKPYTTQLWPGMRAKKALKTTELQQLEDWAKEKLGKDRLWMVEGNDDVTVDSNSVHLTGAKEGGPRPHVDDRNLCRYAAVLYLSPEPKPESGTSFYRLRYDNGAPGGNIVPAPYTNLVDALKTNSLPATAWYEECQVENQFNRILLFKGNMIHGATGYFGKDKRERRLVALYFWMAED
jgi:hypothetical protein